jgi:hypothetical protein
MNNMSVSGGSSETQSHHIEIYINRCASIKVRLTIWAEAFYTARIEITRSL